MRGRSRTCGANSNARTRDSRCCAHRSTSSTRASMARETGSGSTTSGAANSSALIARNEEEIGGDRGTARRSRRTKYKCADETLAAIRDGTSSASTSRSPSTPERAARHREERSRSSGSCATSPVFTAGRVRHHFRQCPIFPQPCADRNRPPPPRSTRRRNRAGAEPSGLKGWPRNSSCGVNSAAIARSARSRRRHSSGPERIAADPGGSSRKRNASSPRLTKLSTVKKSRLDVLEQTRGAGEGSRKGHPGSARRPRPAGILRKPRARECFRAISKSNLSSCGPSKRRSGTISRRYWCPTRRLPRRSSTC